VGIRGDGVGGDGSGLGSASSGWAPVAGSSTARGQVQSRHVHTGSAVQPSVRLPDARGLSRTDMATASGPFGSNHPDMRVGRQSAEFHAPPQPQQGRVVQGSAAMGGRPFIEQGYGNRQIGLVSGSRVGIDSSSNRGGGGSSGSASNGNNSRREVDARRGNTPPIAVESDEDDDGLPNFDLGIL